jgi:hypothetical protein
MLAADESERRLQRVWIRSDHNPSAHGVLEMKEGGGRHRRRRFADGENPGWLSRVHRIARQRACHERARLGRTDAGVNDSEEVLAKRSER